MNIFIDKTSIAISKTFFRKERLIILKIAMCIAFLFFLSGIFHSCTIPDQDVVVTSPDGNFRFELQMEESAPFYRAYFNNREFIGKSSLGFKLSGKGIVLRNVIIKSVSENKVDGDWKPVYGEKNLYPEKYHQAIVSFSAKDKDVPVLQLNIRVYNEGIAFRYEFENKEQIIIESELTEFALPQQSELWVSLRAQDPIVKRKFNDLENDPIERPLLAQLNDSLFVALGEAGLIDFARMKFVVSKTKPATLVADLDGEVVYDSAFTSPWRVIMAGNSAGEILENNYLFLNLNEPNKLTSSDWIKPGKIIREVTLTTRGGIACVDFAVKHNIQYVEYDAGWYGYEYTDASDASTVTVDPNRSPGPLDLQEVINYAEEKGVGIILYVNQKSLSKQLDQILPLYKSWGVKGLKYGFVNVGSQESTMWLQDAVKKAGEYELMVDIHDEYRPTGFSRTYPNLMTQEGIRGDEESPDNEHTLITMFTRMIAGAGDNTNCYFAERVDKMGSHGSQMAKAICIYSPWQFIYWYDRPESSPRKKGGAGETTLIIKEIPDLQFYDALPTVWDITKVLEGKIGEYATIARKSGNNWFIGSLTNEARDVEISLKFLEKDSSYLATIFQDDAKLNTQTKVGIKKVVINSTSVLNFKLNRKNGLAIIIERN